MTPRQHRSSGSESGPTLARNILDGVLDPLLTLDSTWTVTSANPTFYEAFDLAASQVLSQRLDRIGEGLWNLPDLLDLLRQVHETGQPLRNYEVTREFQSLGRRTMLLNACKIQPDEHQEAFTLLGMKDITAFKEVEQAQHRSNQTLRLIFENAQEFAIIGMDLEGRVTMWNAGAEQVLGFSTEEMIGEDARIIFTPEDRQQGKPEQELELARETGRAINERWHIRKNGSRFWGSGLVTPLYDDDDQPQGLLKIMRDMTSEHLLREEREARARDLEQRIADATAESEHRAARLEEMTRHLHEAEQRERRRLAKMLHDDLQQLLVAIKMRLQIAEKEDKPAVSLQETRRLVDEAVETARSLSHELSPSVLWERGFVPALQWLGQNIEERYQLPVTITVEADEKVSDLISAAVGEPVYQMVRELLFNVVKHANATEARVLVAPLGDDGLQLVVEDNGVGCDPDLISGSEDGGHGLGLRGIRERLLIWQGEITTDSHLKSGCRVKLTIPHLPTA